MSTRETFVVVRKVLRVVYAVVAFVLFLSLIVVGVVLLLRPELADAYLRRVLFAVVGGAVILLVADIISKRIDRH